jgi:osmoprotectant transport system permease protein
VHRDGAVGLPATSCLARNAWICGEYISTRRHTILSDLREHVILTLVAVGIGFAISVPLSLFVRRFRRTEGFVIGMTSVLYGIPSVALFALLVPFTGLSATTVEIGLITYTLVIFVRNNLAGLDSVPPDVVDAARGMGMGSLRMLFRVELPLALPAILAGLRVATVSTIALVTVGALVGTGGLGQELNDAFSSVFKAEALTAAVLCVLLALFADLLIVGAGWLLTPWRHKRRLR